MSRVYGREYDVRRASEAIVKNKDVIKNAERECLKMFRTKTSWDDVFDVFDDLGKYNKASNMKKIAEVEPVYGTNVLLSKPFISVYEDNHILTYPTLTAREIYRIYTAYFYGKKLVGNKKYMDEYPELIPLLFEYFSLKERVQNPLDTFEQFNLQDKLKMAKSFLRLYNKFHKNEEKYELEDFESEVLILLQSYSSLDASLQLIDMFEDDQKKALKIMGDVIENNKETSEILYDNGIETYHYPRLIKTIVGQKNK